MKTEIQMNCQRKDQWYSELHKGKDMGKCTKVKDMLTNGKEKNALKKSLASRNIPEHTYY